MTPNSINIWVADFETEAKPFYDKFGYTKTWLTYIENLHNDDNNLTITIKRFHNYIYQIAKDRNRCQYVYFHNLSFDGTFLLYFLNGINANYETTINQFKKIYEIKVYINKSVFISYRCSLMIFMTSVANLPKSTKSKIDYEKIRNYKKVADATKKEIDYIKQDVKTVKYNLLELEKQGVILDKYFKTMASISYNDLRTRTHNKLKKNGSSWYFLFPKIDLETDEYLRNAYLGGLTYLNPKYQNKLLDYKVISFDRVSSYPSVMVNEWLPAGKPKMSLTKPKNNRLYVVRFRVLKATIKKGYHPFIASTRKMRYINDIYPKTIESRMLTLDSITFELFKKYYNATYEIIDYMLFPRKVKGIFNDYILDVYNTKKTTKEIIKKAEREKTTDTKEYHDAKFNNFWSKLKLNSPYGKFGTNPKLTSNIPRFNDDGMLEWTEETEEKEQNRFYLPLAIFITAYARLRLIEQIQANRERFIYCDTDSIHLTETSTPTSLNDLIGNQLNKWESEGIAYKSKYLKAKRYIKLKKNKKGKLELTRTIGGLNRTEHNRINFDNFKSGVVIKDGKKISKNVKGGRIIYPLDFTFKI